MDGNVHRNWSQIMCENNLKNNKKKNYGKFKVHLVKCICNGNGATTIVGKSLRKNFHMFCEQTMKNKVKNRIK